MIGRGEIVDMLVGEGESLVLTPHQCLRLTDVPTAVLELLTQPRSRGQLEAHVTSQFGPPPEGRLDELLAELVAQGLIEI